MDITGSDAVSSARTVREAVLGAMRRRRSRDAMRRLWQVSPLVAAGAVAAALVARWMAWPAAVPIAALAAGAAALALYSVVARRTPGMSDALAARVDDEAGLGGELRSATWFASREQRDAWADEHVIRAARRLQHVDWHQLYPAARAPRSALATLALIVTAAALAATFPDPGAAPGAAPGSDHRQTVTRDALRLAEALPPELLRRLEELLAAAEAGDSAAVRALAANGDLQALLDRVAASGDPTLLEALARSLAPATESAKAADALADRARAAAESAAMSAAMRDALAELADQLELVGPEQTASGAGSESAPSEAAPAEGTGQARGTSAAEQLTIQFAEATESGGTGGVMLLSNQEASEGGGAPGAGFGGADTPEAGGQTAEIDAALRREVVAAHQDAPGAGSDTELHRRTAQSEAAAAFTRAAAGRFEAAPGAAPPPVPEARRSGLRNYFVRVPR